MAVEASGLYIHTTDPSYPHYPRRETIVRHRCRTCPMFRLELVHAMRGGRNNSTRMPWSARSRATRTSMLSELFFSLSRNLLCPRAELNHEHRINRTTKKVHSAG